MANDSDFVYHWTHKKNIASILHYGLDPRYATGKLPVVWFCDHNRVGWALTHIALRHKWNEDDMVLLRWPKYKYPFAFTAFEDVYTTTRVIRFAYNTHVKWGVLGRWDASVTVRRRTDKPDRMNPDTDKPDCESDL